MDGSIRVSAKTVDDAITEALIQLGVTSDRLEYEVIEKGSAGFLGINRKDAVALGPYLAAGCILAIFTGRCIFDYLGFGLGWPWSNI